MKLTYMSSGGLRFRELKKGETPGLLQLKTDKALLCDPKFHSYVELYAKVGHVSVCFIVKKVLMM